MSTPRSSPAAGAAMGASSPDWLAPAATVGVVRLSVPCGRVFGVASPVANCEAFIFTFHRSGEPVASLTDQLLALVWTLWTRPLSDVAGKSLAVKFVPNASEPPLRVSWVVSVEATAPAGARTATPPATSRQRVRLLNMRDLLGRWGRVSPLIGTAPRTYVEQTSRIRRFLRRR